MLPTEGRRLTLLDCVGIGINGIVGSGIFFLPAIIGASAGSLAPLAFVATGLLCLLVALCFAEVSSLFDRSGGPYLYAREAFGERFASLVGGMALVSTCLGYAAVSRKLGEELGAVVGLTPGYGTIGLSWFAMGGLALLNLRGVRFGALATNVLTFVKLAPLIVFALVGLFLADPGIRAAQPTPTAEGFGFAMLLAVFTFTGFEFVSVVAGETDNPKRDIPLALIGSLAGSVVLYSAIQWVLNGVLTAPGEASAPIALAAEKLGGSWAGDVIRGCAIASMTGFVAGSALVGPRVVSSLAEGGGLPSFLAKRSGGGVPGPAIVVLSGLSMVLVAVLPFESLADLTVMTMFWEYTPTVIALIVFRWKRPEAPRSFRVPAGPLVAAVCVGLMLLLLAQSRPADLVFGGYILGAVTVLALANALWKRHAPPPSTN